MRSTVLLCTRITKSEERLIGLLQILWITSLTKSAAILNPLQNWFCKENTGHNGVAP